MKKLLKRYVHDEVALAVLMREDVPCFICGNTSHKKYIIAKSLFTGKNVTIVQCEKCGLFYVGDRISAIQLLDAYVQGDNFVSYFKEKEGWDAVFLKDIACQLSAYFEHRAGLKLLDIGCGTGTFLKIAQEIGFDAVGIEPNKKAAEYAADKNHVTALQGTLDDYDFSPETFDAVSLIQTLEHLPDPLKTLSDIRMVLKKGGAVFIEVPNFSNIFFLASRLFGIRDRSMTIDPAHVWYFTVKSLKKLVKAAGLEIISVDAGFNKALLDMSTSKLMRTMLRVPYGVFRAASKFAGIGMAVQLIAVRK